jgi:uncharacterized protein (TIGR03435 family)
MRLPKPALVILSCLIATAQTTFNTADVHVSPKTPYPAIRTSLRAGRFDVHHATMVDLIAVAYGVEPDKVLGGPSWLETDRFDIAAVVSAEVTPPAVRPILQALLKDRFDLVVHPDNKPTVAFLLSLGSGKPKLNQSQESGPPACQRQPLADDTGAIRAACHGVTMQAFAQQLRSAAGDYLPNPVIDQTALEGRWDFTLQWAPRNQLARATGGISIFEAVDKQLGLKLESRQVPTPVIVVDRVNRAPAANPSGVAALPPPPPARFEVATVKPSGPQSQEVRVQTLPNGTLNLQGVTLSYLIQTIWFLTPDMIVGAPKWLDTDRWDITGRLPATPGSPPAMDIDSLAAMTRALLEDRFGLKTHLDERTVPAYTLTALRPKPQKADPANRSGCKEGPEAGGKDPRVTTPVLSRLVACRNVTMTQFADLLPNIANALNPLNGSIRSTVLDATHLEGAWDFMLSFTPSLGFAPNGTPSGTPGDLPADPNGAISLPDAISRQLGLKLGMEKRPAQVLVIDHIDQKPRDN